MAVPVFPSLIGVSFPVNRSPTWRTIKQEAISGKEYRISTYLYPRYKYKILLDYLGSGEVGQNQDWQSFMGFFNEISGSTLPFLWNDPYDFAVNNQNLGLGTGSQVTYNFVRSLGGFTEPVQAVQTVTNVSINGTTTTSYGVVTDPNFGLTYALTFSSAPSNGAVITWTGTYDWPCRFDTDSADLNNIMLNFWELKEISFMTMKVV